MTIVKVATITVLLLAGCSTPAMPTRQAKLLALASDETQLIADPGDRLSRQLNFAFEQSNRGQTAEAKSSLAHAAETLRGVGPKQLDEQKWIAGWVSISELSRKIDDTASADAACDQAVTQLRKLEPVEDRPQFAVGVSEEVNALHGPAAAAKVLEESAPWTAGIKDVSVRRVALSQISGSIFKCDDYSGGLVALRTDPDAAWRSDTLRDFAELFRPPLKSDYEGFNQNGAVGGFSAMALPGKNDITPQYSKPVDFRSNFQRGE